MKSHAFNRTTLVLRKDLLEEGLHDFDFVCSPEGIEEIRRIINSEVVKKKALTFSTAVTINFVKYGLDGEITEKASPCFLSKPHYVNNVSNYNIKEILQGSVLEVQRRYDDFVSSGSGWTLQSFKWFDLHISQTNDLRGGCNNIFLKDTTNVTSRRGGLLSINNKDNQCLLYCIAAAFTCKKKLSISQRTDASYYIDFVNLIRVSDSRNTIKFPIALSNISELERINRSGVNAVPFRVNVFREEPISKKLHLIRSSSYDDGKVINVLLTEFEDEESEYSHYVLIDGKSFFRKRYISSKNAAISYAHTIFCSKCFEHFRSKTQLESHEKVCGKTDHIRVFPNDGERIEYKNYEFNFKRIFTGYADFESVLENTHNSLECSKCGVSCVEDNEESECTHSFTIHTKIHRAICVCFVIVDRYGSLVHEFSYTGDDVVVQFINNVLECEELLIKTTKFNKYMIFTKENRADFEKANVCFICNNNRGMKGRKEHPFCESDPKVRDHDHVNGLYLGAAHKTCNLNKRREKPFLSVFLHNFSGYDSHLILPALTKNLLPNVENVSVIPKSIEKFMAIKINQRITFLDSMSFLTSGLDTLFETVNTSCSYNIIKQSNLMCDFINNEKVLKIDADNRLKYLIRKGSFPYEFAKSLSDYSLPNLVPKEAFYNSITRTHITEEKYKLAKEIWNVFDMKCMRDYMEIYCMCDTLLLAEVFEAFRYESLNNFEIDPTHFISLPGFAYSAFLKVTGVSLDYISDPEIFDMLSSNLRGGHSFCSQRYEESTLFKNGLPCEGNQATCVDQHLIYIDANNL
jgi:hypothetical protein